MSADGARPQASGRARSARGPLVSGRAIALVVAHRALFARALRVLIDVRVGLALRGARATAARLSRRPLAPAGHSAAALSWAVDRVAPLVPGARCLARSMALARLLAAEGVAVDVRVGVRRAAATGRLEAHAWLVQRGAAVTDGGAADFGDYAPLVDLADIR